MTRAPGVLRRSWDSDLAYSFRNSPYAIVAALGFLLCVGSSVFAGRLYASGSPRTMNIA